MSSLLLEAWAFTLALKGPVRLRPACFILIARATGLSQYPVLTDPRSLDKVRTSLARKVSVSSRDQGSVSSEDGSYKAV